MDRTPIVKRFKTIVKHEINTRTKDISDEFEESKIKSETAKESLKAAYKLIDYLKQHYKDELKIKKRKDIPAWRQQAKICKALDKFRFEDVYAYIWTHTLSLKDALQLAESKKIGNHKRTIKTGKKQGKEIESAYVLFVPDYDDMENELKLGLKSIQKYLNKFAQLEILMKMKKSGHINNMIYAVGYYSSFKDKKTGESRDNRISFMKDTPEMKEKLRNFRL